MSTENHAIVHQLVDAWNRSDIDGVLALFDSACEVVFPPDVPVQNLGVALQTAGVALFSNESVPPNLAELVGKIAPRPILLIYAVDSGGGEELNEEYFEAAEEPKALWAVSVGGHVGSQGAEPEEFERRVVGFFDDALLDTGAG